MSLHSTREPAPVLLIPYTWIGDFVRGHSVVKLLRAQSPERPVDILATPLCAPLVAYMPGVRKALVAELPRRRISLRQQIALSELIEAENYGQTIVLPRTWKAVLAPILAGVPVRTGFFGEARVVLINDLRFGERALPRMIDRMGSLALPKNAPLPKDWPLPELIVPPREIDAWRVRRGLAGERRPVVTLAPGAVGAGKAWPVSHFAQLARALAADGLSVWVLGGPSEAELAKQIISLGGASVRDLTGNDLRDAILAHAAADVAVTNDSGLMHVAAALGTPTVAIFGPTSAWHQKPLNPLAAIIEPPGDDAARERARTEGNDAVAHMRTDDVAVEAVLAAVRRVLGKGAANP
ncbi:MAG: lipopolysaccharide heptosyltransferase II [Pseudolabrys sp.]